MSVWLKEWRAAFPLTPLFFLLLLGVWTAVPLQAQSETESGYPAPPGEQPIEAEEIWPDEPYPAPTPFTLIPLDTPESETFPGDSDSGYDPGQAPTFDGGLPSVGSTPAGNGQAVSGERLKLSLAITYRQRYRKPGASLVYLQRSVTHLHRGLVLVNYAF
jgi:hypothetical protein